MRKSNNKSQTHFEYVAIICIFVAALVTSFVYITRTLQGRYRESGDVFGQREQYQRGVTIETEVEPWNFGITPPVVTVDMCPSVVAQVSEYETKAADLLTLVANLNQQVVKLEESSAQDTSGSDVVQGYVEDLRTAAEDARQSLQLILAVELDAAANLLEQQIVNGVEVTPELLSTAEELRTSTGAARTLLLISLAAQFQADPNWLERQAGNDVEIKAALSTTAETIRESIRAKQADAEYNQDLANNLRNAQPQCF